MESDDDDDNIVTFEDFLALKRMIDRQSATIAELMTALEHAGNENKELKKLHLETIEDINKNCEATQEEMSLLSELQEKEDAIRNWEANTTGLRDIIDISRTAISDKILLCLSVQLDNTTEKSTCAIVSEHFQNDEVEHAKNILFDVCGGPDTAIGPKEQRKGGSKQIKKEKDLIDIIKAMKTLRTEGTEPMFITSKEGIIQLEESNLLSCLRKLNTTEEECQIKRISSELEKTSDEKNKQKIENVQLKNKITSFNDLIKLKDDDLVKNKSGKKSQEVKTNQSEAVASCSNSQIDIKLEKFTCDILEMVTKIIDEKLAVVSNFRNVETMSVGNDKENIRSFKNALVQSSKVIDTKIELKEILNENRNDQLIQEAERKTRSRNIIIHGVPEVDDENRERKDVIFITAFIEALGLNYKPQSMSRLGKLDSNKTRPIKMKMTTECEKQNIMSRLSNLKNGESCLKTISVTDDYTIEERNIIRNWVNKANEKNRSEKGNVIWKARGSPTNGGMRLVRLAKRPSIRGNIHDANTTECD